MTPAAGFSDVLGSGAGDLAHGVVEGQAEDLNAEVNGVASEVVYNSLQSGQGEPNASITASNCTCNASRPMYGSIFMPTFV